MDPGIAGGIAAAIAVPIVLAYLQRAGRRIVTNESAPILSDPGVRLCERGWLFRTFVVKVEGREYALRYGFSEAGEHVIVDDKIVASARGFVFLERRFDFPIADRKGVIELDVRWFLLIKGFRLSLDGVPLYNEGTFAS